MNKVRVSERVIVNIEHERSGAGSRYLVEFSTKLLIPPSGTTPLSTTTAPVLFGWALVSEHVAASHTVGKHRTSTDRSCAKGTFMLRAGC